MINENEKVYFTIYGQWFDKPYEDLYKVNKIITNKDEYIIYLENNKFIITVFRPSEITNTNDEITIINSKNIKLELINHEGKYDCVKYTRKDYIFNKVIKVEHYFDNGTKLKYSETKKLIIKYLLFMCLKTLIYRIIANPIEQLPTKQEYLESRIDEVYQSALNYHR